MNRSEVLALRSRAMQAVRRFFVERDFIEVDTPVRISTPALEVNIDAEPAGDHYLRTSPEFHMKRLLAEGVDRCFQLGPCFRSGERGQRHSPEFAMLEWYRTGADYLDVLVDTKALIDFVAREVLGTTTLRFRRRPIELMPLWEHLTVQQAFIQFAGWDPVLAYDPDRFDLDLVSKVEPALPFDVPFVLTDYPSAAAALARLRPEDPAVAERWELYIGGLELANAFSELTDAAEQRRRFAQWAEERRARGAEVYALDEPFLAALEAGLPPCAGVALGFDRLVMLLAGRSDIGDVQPFPAELKIEN